MRFIRNVLLVGLFVIMSVTLTGAQQKEESDKKSPEKKFKVQVVVDQDGKFDELDLRAASYIKRELRGLGDVEVVNYSVEWSLHLVVFETKTVNGHVTGIVLGVVFTRSMIDILTNDLVRYKKQMPDLGDDVVKALAFLHPYESYQSVSVFADGKDKLREVCERAVTKFDILYLEPARSK